MIRTIEGEAVLFPIERVVYSCPDDLLDEVLGVNGAGRLD